MKKIKEMILLPLIFVGLNTFSQDWSTCDDFTDLSLYPAELIAEGELIGYSQGGLQEINSTMGAFVNVNGGNEGIYGVGMIDFDFDGGNQTARFLMYGILSQFDHMGFTVNGSTLVQLDETFPMTVAGVEIDLDLSPANDGSWEYFYLTFTGEIDSISQDLFESAVVELCVEPLEVEGAGVTEERINQLSAYPNPVDDVLTLANIEPLESVKIYSVSGELLVVHTPLLDEIIQLNFSELEAGFYFVVGKSLNGQEFVSKITKN